MWGSRTKATSSAIELRATSPIVIATAREIVAGSNMQTHSDTGLVPEASTVIRRPRRPRPGAVGLPCLTLVIRRFARELP